MATSCGTAVVPVHSSYLENTHRDKNSPLTITLEICNETMDVQLCSLGQSKFITQGKKIATGGNISSC